MLGKFRERRKVKKIAKINRKLDKLKVETLKEELGDANEGTDVEVVESKKEKKTKKSADEVAFDKVIEDVTARKRLLTELPINGVKYDARKKISLFKSPVMWFKNKYFPGRTMLVQMELITGSHRQFFINEKHTTFDFNDGTYVIDTDLKFWVEDCKSYGLRYHQAFCLPLKPELDVTEVKKAITALGGVEIENSTNPNTLKELIVSKIAKEVMQSGSAFEDALKSIKMFLLAILIMVAVHLTTWVVKSGMLKSIKIPGM